MKTILKLFLCLFLVLGFSDALTAAEVSFHGNFDFFAGYSEYENFIGDSDKYGHQSEGFEAVRELKLYSFFKASDNLKAVMSMQLGEAYSHEDGGYFGTPSADMGGEADADSALELDMLYLDFTWPGTELNFKIGNQFIELPDAAIGGSNLLREVPAAVTMNTPLPFQGETYKTSLQLGWARFHSDVEDVSSDKEDFMWAITPIETKNFTLRPYCAYLTVGEKVWNGEDQNGRDWYDHLYFDYAPFFEEILGRPIGACDDAAEGYYGGMRVSLNMFDPFGIEAAFNYGKLEFNTVDGLDPEVEGIHCDMAVDYKKLNSMTPRFIFSWSEGPDEGDENVDMFPPVVPGTIYDTNMSDGSLINDADTMIGHQTLHSVCQWIIGFQLNDIQFFDKLSNDIYLHYHEGTADDDIFEDPNVVNHYSTILNDDTSAVSIGFNTQYQLFKSMDILSEIGYINFDEDDDYDEDVLPDIEDQFKAFAGLRYKF